MTLNIQEIYPLIVPTNYYSAGSWDLPHFPFQNSKYILTWTVFTSNDTMSYLTREQFLYLNEKYENWQQFSFENLRHSCYDACFFNDYKLSKDESRLIYIYFQNRDAIGSSRILFSKEFSIAFPDGYYIAFPDRSCGFVIAKNITKEELKDVNDLIIRMQSKATTAMSNLIHSPEEFALPTNWIQPFDESVSEELINDIINYTPK